MPETQPAARFLEWRAGVPYFHGVRVEHRRTIVAGRELTLAVLTDAAALIDLPHLEQQFLQTDRLPYGLELWPSSQILAERLLTGEPGAGREALEIGCGLGLVAIAATLAGWRVRATDVDAMALDFARMNAALNGVEVAEWGELDWADPPAGRRFERILAADVLYEAPQHAPILACLRRLLAPGGAALISDPNRGSADRFADLAREAGFEARTLPGEAENHLGRLTKGRVFELRPRGGGGS